ncbi:MULTISPECIES: hypothetical protein [unclassified Microbacterium]|uniref:hypothetical protein n=1 Tax=unclassified Microbacterium TaxID=2609290 RepID=UPI00214B3C03|nr:MULTISPECIES: hypothetical protein [unclassified Microbacterium]MCR2785256.1 hypothetical protein [Microbacterium sp. zg.B96]MDL5352618.1 hypothetical protein [Microbacterium sp. zg-YB36]WIM16786.1 hypothetical protein QNO11_03845 [Microbacterium sp. zg-B96]
MSIELNRPALRHARALIRDGKVVRDDRDAWSEAAPGADEENAFIERAGWTEYAHWHLGVDRDQNRHTKQAYTFPFGDFRRVHRSGIISAESRAGQHDHAEIRDALKSLLELIDADAP